MFLAGSKDKKGYITLGNSYNVLSTWYCANFLKRYLNKQGDYSFALKQCMLW